MQTGSGSREEAEDEAAAANLGQQEVSVFSTATKGTGKEPCGLSSQLLEKASSQFQPTWGQELLRLAALCGGLDAICLPVSILLLW